MAIVKLNKMTLFGPVTERDEVLDGLQQLGCMHLVNLREQRAGKALEHPRRNEVQAALRYLDACPVQESPARHRRGLDSREVAREALQIQEQRRELAELRDQLKRKIEAASPWGEFQLPATDALGGQHLRFYAVRHRRLGELAATDLTWQLISRDNQFAYVVVVAARQPVGVPGELRELDSRPLSELKAHLIDVEEELERTQLRRIWLTRWSAFLREVLDQVDDELARQEAHRLMLEDPSLFAIQGWVPLPAEEAVRTFATRRGLALTIAKPQRDERPPTLLKNPQVVAGAEGAVTFYITPEYRSWDPTWVVFFSFSCFFAMIMSDAGYGLLLGVLLAFLWRRLSGSKNQARFRNLLLMIVLTTCAYGVLLGSYFGVEPPPNSLWGRWQLRFEGESLMGQNSRYAMMGVAVSIGVFHLMLANLITAWRYRWSSRSLGAVGWAIVLLGGWVLGVGALQMIARETQPIHQWLAATFVVPIDQVKQSLVSLGKFLVLAGAVCVFAFSSTRPLFSLRISDWVWRMLDGLQALTGVSQAFGDVLSYLRLFALGLASAQLATTFNSLAVETVKIPGLGILLAILIVLVGHGINLLLGIMGGVVHGLRLNCIEFFNWSLKDEGYPFRAFCKKAGC